MANKTHEKMLNMFSYQENANQNYVEAGHVCLTPIILATWEVEIRRTEVQGQPRQIVHEPHLQNNQGKMD
jgi:hypothetical protein